jgi:hypothetical protein
LKVIVKVIEGRRERRDLASLQSLGLWSRRRDGGRDGAECQSGESSDLHEGEHVEQLGSRPKVYDEKKDVEVQRPWRVKKEGVHHAGFIVLLRWRQRRQRLSFAAGSRVESRKSTLK